MQRLSDSWRTRLGSSSLIIINSFFESNNELATNESRRAFAVDILEDLKFVYADIKGTVGFLFRRLLYLRADELIGIQGSISKSVTATNIRSTLYRYRGRREDSCIWGYESE